MSFSDWVSDLAAESYQSFVRAAEIGSTINEHWLIYNSSVYLWNYSQYLISCKQTDKLVKPFKQIYQLLKGIQ